MGRVVTTRTLQSADREYRNSANRAIRGDIVRALNELILNCDDSYSRQGAPDRRIDVEIRRLSRRDGGGARIWVRDLAEGMAGGSLDRALGTYGEAQSGLYDGAHVRGYFGHGLKDAILGLGAGAIHSFQNGQYTHATLIVNDAGTPQYTRHEAVRATKFLRNKFGIPDNGTVAEIATRPEIAVPLFDRLQETLSRHYLLRRVTANPQTEVTLRYDRVTRDPQSARLRYLEPETTETLIDDELPWGEDHQARFVVRRATVPLDPPSAGPTSDGGFLVLGSIAVLDQTLFKFEGDPAAECLYGFVESSRFDDLLRADAPILQSTRDGLIWSYPELANLRRAIEQRLDPVVEAERERLRALDQHARNNALRQKFDRAFEELNKIADTELSGPGGPGRGPSGPSISPEPVVPPDGFGFLNEYFNVKVARDGSLAVRAASSKFTPGSPVSFLLSTDQDFTLRTTTAILKPIKDHPAVLEARVIVRGNRMGAQTVLRASCAGTISECLLQVVGDREPPPPPPARGGALFRTLRFDTQRDPRTRVRYDRESGDIVIQTLAPSVGLYIGEGGRGAESAQGSVLCAELVLEAVCREVARRGVESGIFIAPTGGETEAINREYDRFRIKYAEPLHRLFAYSPSTRRGKPTAEEAMASAVRPT